MKVTLPKHIPGILNDIPEDQQPKGEEVAKFWLLVAFELAEMLKEASRVETAQVVLNNYRQANSQYIWEFYVNDLSLPDNPNAINWHGQNASRWSYAGCILLQDGRVSAHH